MGGLFSPAAFFAAWIASRRTFQALVRDGSEEIRAGRSRQAAYAEALRRVREPGQNLEQIRFNLAVLRAVANHTGGFRGRKADHG